MDTTRTKYNDPLQQLTLEQVRELNERDAPGPYVRGFTERAPFWKFVGVVFGLGILESWVQRVLGIGLVPLTLGVAAIAFGVAWAIYAPTRRAYQLANSLAAKRLGFDSHAAYEAASKARRRRMKRSAHASVESRAEREHTRTTGDVEFANCEEYERAFAVGAAVEGVEATLNRPDGSVVLVGPIQRAETPPATVVQRASGELKKAGGYLLGRTLLAASALSAGAYLAAIRAGAMDHGWGQVATAFICLLCATIGGGLGFAIAVSRVFLDATSAISQAIDANTQRVLQPLAQGLQSTRAGIRVSETASFLDEWSQRMLAPSPDRGLFTRLATLVLRGVIGRARRRVEASLLQHAQRRGSDSLSLEDLEGALRGRLLDAAFGRLRFALKGFAFVGRALLGLAVLSLYGTALLAFGG